MLVTGFPVGAERERGSTRPGELSGSPAPARHQPRAEVLLVQHSVDRRAHVGDARRVELQGRPIAGFIEGGGTGTRNRYATRHGLDDRQAEPFAERRLHDEPGAAVEGREVAFAYRPPKEDRFMIQHFRSPAGLGIARIFRARDDKPSNNREFRDIRDDDVTTALPRSYDSDHEAHQMKDRRLDERERSG